MRANRFTMTNRDAFQAEQDALPLAQHVARALTSSGVVKRFQRVESPSTHADWLVFKDGAGAGFAIRVDDTCESTSPLQRTLRFVRHAQTIVNALGNPRSFPCVLTFDRQPPPEWGVWRLDGVAAHVWCAASHPVIKMPRCAVQPHRDPSVRVRIYGVAKDIERLEVGAAVKCEMIDVWMPEFGIRGRGMCGGEGMTIEITECNEVREHQIPGVRLDLGEIEMRLSDLVGLRPGAVINLGEVALERCFVRLGASVLAEGKFRTSEGQLLLTIESVL